MQLPSHISYTNRAAKDYPVLPPSRRQSPPRTAAVSAAEPLHVPLPPESSRQTGDLGVVPNVVYLMPIFLAITNDPSIRITMPNLSLSAKHTVDPMRGSSLPNLEYLPHRTLLREPADNDMYVVRHNAPFMERIQFPIAVRQNISQCRGSPFVSEEAFPVSRIQVLLDMLVVDRLQRRDLVRRQWTLRLAGQRGKPLAFRPPDLQLCLRDTVRKMQGDVVNRAVRLPSRQVMPVRDFGSRKRKVRKGGDWKDGLAHGASIANTPHLWPAPAAETAAVR